MNIELCRVLIKLFVGRGEKGWNRHHVTSFELYTVELRINANLTANSDDREASEELVDSFGN